MVISSIYRLGGLLLVSMVLSATALASSKSDLAKEKRWEEQIVPGIIVGEGIKLKSDNVEFLALYAEPGTDESKGGVILLHGIGVHPAWPDVIDPLRMQLPDNGWHTLSLQMPVLKNEAEIDQYPPLFPEVPGRIQAGVDFLKNKGIKKIVIMGHSLGSTMAHHYLATRKDPAIKGFAILSGGPGIPENAAMNTVENFKKIKDIKIVDFNGSEDIERVLNTAPKRNKLGKQLHGSRYQNFTINGANHFYQNKQDELTGKLLAWLNSQI